MDNSKRIYVTPHLTTHGSLSALTAMPGNCQANGKGPAPLDGCNAQPNSKCPEGTDGQGGCHLLS